MVKIGVVTALFNDEVTKRLEKGALDHLRESGLTDGQIISIRVPGAFEVPLAVQALFEKKKVDGVVALGAVIRGDTTHYDYVCQAVERGCSTLALKFKKPVGFGILTTENEEQAMARAGGAHGNKGRDAAQTVLEVCDLLSRLDALI